MGGGGGDACAAARPAGAVRAGAGAGPRAAGVLLKVGSFSSDSTSGNNVDVGKGVTGGEEETAEDDMDDLLGWLRGRGLHSFPIQLDFSSSVHRITRRSS